MTEEELNTLKEKDITQWLIKRGEQKMLEDNGNTPQLLALPASEFLKVDFDVVVKAKRNWHTPSTTKKH